MVGNFADEVNHDSKHRFLLGALGHPAERNLLAPIHVNLTWQSTSHLQPTEFLTNVLV